MLLIDNCSMKLKLLHRIISILESHRKKWRIRHTKKFFFFFVVSEGCLWTKKKDNEKKLLLLWSCFLIIPSCRKDKNKAEVYFKDHKGQRQAIAKESWYLVPKC